MLAVGGPADALGDGLTGERWKIVKGHIYSIELEFQRLAIDTQLLESENAKLKAQLRQEEHRDHDRKEAIVPRSLYGSGRGSGHQNAAPSPLHGQAQSSAKSRSRITTTMYNFSSERPRAATDDGHAEGVPGGGEKSRKSAIRPPPLPPSAPCWKTADNDAADMVPPLPSGERFKRGVSLGGESVSSDVDSCAIEGTPPTSGAPLLLAGAIPAAAAEGSSAPPLPPTTDSCQHPLSEGPTRGTTASDMDNDLPFMNSDQSGTERVVLRRKDSGAPSCFKGEDGDSVSFLEEAPTAQLWSTWNERNLSKENFRTFASSKRTYGASTSATGFILKNDVKRAGDSLMSSSCMQRFITRPSSPKRIAWDFMSVMIMAYDLIFIPLQVFDLNDLKFQTMMGFVTTCFWTCDILMSVTSGYNFGGLIEMRPKQVLFHYLRTWFPIDILVISVDWVVLAVDSSDIEGIGLFRLNKTLRIMRVLRFLRLLRLLRMLKILTVMSELHDMIHSEVLVTVLNVCQFIIGILLLNHYIACGWYGVGDSLEDDGDWRNTWVTRLQQNTGKEVDVGYAYLTSLHWSLTQFTPASMEVVPCNTIERAYTISVMLFSFVLFSSLLSSITTSMINLRKKSEEKRKQMTLVRRYITEKHVTLDLGNRIAGFLRQHGYNCSQRMPLHEDQILAFKILPESLRSQLRCEVMLPVIIPHPLFRVLRALDEPAMINVCTLGTSEKALGIGEDVFNFGDTATHMYIPIVGILRYFRYENLELHTEVLPGTFISEAALWVMWEHKGRLQGGTPSDLVTLNTASFQAVITRSVSFQLCRTYAKEYYSELAETEAVNPEHITDIVDLKDGVKDMVKRALSMQSVGSGEKQFCRKASTETFNSIDRCRSLPSVGKAKASSFFARLIRRSRPSPSGGERRGSHDRGASPRSSQRHDAQPFQVDRILSDGSDSLDCAGITLSPPRSPRSPQHSQCASPPQSPRRSARMSESERRPSA